MFDKTKNHLIQTYLIRPTVNNPESSRAHTSYIFEIGVGFPDGSYNNSSSTNKSTPNKIELTVIDMAGRETPDNIVRDHRKKDISFKFDHKDCYTYLTKRILSPEEYNQKNFQDLWRKDIHDNYVSTLLHFVQDFEQTGTTTCRKRKIVFENDLVREVKDTESCKQLINEDIFNSIVHYASLFIESHYIRKSLMSLTNYFRKRAGSNVIPDFSALTNINILSRTADYIDNEAITVLLVHLRIDKDMDETLTFAHDLSARRITTAAASTSTDLPDRLGTRTSILNDMRELGYYDDELDSIS